MAILFPAPQQYFDNNGDPLAGGKVYFYESGTTTPKDTYTTQVGNVANANPVILDSAGRASIWGTGSYKEVVRTSADVLISTKDAVTLGGTIDAGTVTNAMLANMDANTVKVRSASTSGVPSDVALSASTLLGRGSTGNVAEITLSGLTMTGTVLSPTSPGIGIAQKTGRVYPPAHVTSLSSTSRTTVTSLDNKLIAMPILIPSAITTVSLMMYITTAQATRNVRMGIYSDTAGAPNALVVDAGTFSLASTGVAEIATVQSLAAGVYWLAFVTDGSSAAFTAILRNMVNPIILGTVSAAFASDDYLNTYVYRNFSYAALPNPFGTSGFAVARTALPLMMLSV